MPPKCCINATKVQPKNKCSQCAAECFYPLCFRSDSDGYLSVTSMLRATKCSRTLRATKVLPKCYGMLPPHYRMLPKCDPNNATTTLPNTTVELPQCFLCATTELPMRCRRAALRKCCLRVLPQSYLCATTDLPMCCRRAALRKCHASC